jgi:hypothetical protein
LEKNKMGRSKEVPIEDIFMKIRGDMGHTWSVGAFNKGNDRGDIIEGECRVVEEETLPGSGKLSTQRSEILLLEGENG